MIEIYPYYYESFRCIADKCEDSCCAGWEIDIDDDSYEKYMSVGDAIGEKLKASIRTYGTSSCDDTVTDDDMICGSMSDSSSSDDTMTDGDMDECLSEQKPYEKHGFILSDDMRCPFLDEKGLCELYRELGEASLCEVCTNTPRNFLEFMAEKACTTSQTSKPGFSESSAMQGGICVRQISVSISCPEAARLLFESPEKVYFIEKETSDEPMYEMDESESALGGFLLEKQKEAIEILGDREKSLHERIAMFMAHAEKVQNRLNLISAGDISDIDISGDTISDSLSAGADPDVPASGSQPSDEQELGNYPYFPDNYTSFLRRMEIFSGLASIGKPWSDIITALYEDFVDAKTETADINNTVSDHAAAAGRYKSAIHALYTHMEAAGRMYEYEHLLVYYAFLLLCRAIDDYDYLTRAKLVVASFEMNRDMDAVIFYRKKEFDPHDRQVNSRIYAREIEHSEENLADLSEELMFSN
ncbi:MAG: flagellin lysine-N-methylase [Eubacterium sp.]|nr:flagellin lysine-N-methylase [Eubacterium sp.]